MILLLLPITVLEIKKKELQPKQPVKNSGKQEPADKHFTKKAFLKQIIGMRNASKQSKEPEERKAVTQWLEIKALLDI